MTVGSGETPVEPLSLRAALLTPPGRGGIAVVSVVGPGAIEAVWRGFRPRSGVASDRVEPGRLYYGHFLDARGEVVDEVLVAVLDTEPEHLEVNCHGGVVPSRLVLRELAGLGVEVVTWRDLPACAHLVSGEDLVQKEAREALVRAPTLRVAQMLAAQWRGALSGEVRRLLALLGRAPAERAPAERAPAGGPSAEPGEPALKAVADALSALLDTAHWGLALTEPPKVVLGGRVNVGKSSLANALHQAERYLVAEEPGTTRDLLPGLISLEGLPVELIDAAGIRETRDTVERLAVEHARRGMREAELVLVVFDGSRALLPEEVEFVRRLGEKPILAVVNKCDLPRVLTDGEVEGVVGQKPIHTSAVTGQGLEALRRELARRLFGEVPEDAGRAVVFTRRQVDLLSRARRALAEGSPGARCEAVEALKGLLRETEGRK